MGVLRLFKGVILESALSALLPMSVSMRNVDSVRCPCIAWNSINNTLLTKHMGRWVSTGHLWHHYYRMCVFVGL